MPLILVDVRNLEMDLTFGEQKILGQYMAGQSKLAYSRVAVLHNENHNPNNFVDSFAYNDGNKRAQFESESDAIDWLKG